MSAWLRAIIFHESDEPIASAIERLEETTGREKYLGAVSQKREILVEGKYGGAIADLEVIDRNSRRIKWKGKLISVARGFKKRDVFAALRLMPEVSSMNLRRENTLYLALVSLHLLWVRDTFPNGRLSELTGTFFPPASDYLWLNDFRHVFLVNDQFTGLTFPRLFGTQVANKLLLALAESNVWAKPRNVPAEEVQEAAS